MTIYEAPMHDDLRRRSATVRLARRRLADDRIIPCYQPKLHLAGRSIVGFEAFLGWRTPDFGRGFLFPRTPPSAKAICSSCSF